MRIILFILLSWSSQLFAQSNIYDIESHSIDSFDIALKNFKGRKMVIALASLENLNKGSLKFFDSLQSAYPEMKVLVIPSQDSVTEEGKQIIESARENPVKRSAIFTPVIIAKDKSKEKNRLVKYLTDVKENAHFDVVYNNELQMFVVSESGYLYAVIDSPVSAKALHEILTQKDVTQ